MGRERENMNLDSLQPANLGQVAFFFRQGLQERKGKLPKVLLEQSEGGKRGGETWRTREEKQESSEWFSMK